MFGFDGKKDEPKKDQKAADAEGGSKDAPASSGTGSSHAPPPSLNDNPATSKEGVKDMGKDDLQALIAARISAGKQAHAHVKKIEDAFNEKSGAPAAGNGTNAPASKPAAKIDTSNVDLTKPPPSLEKKDVKNMSKDDLQSLIAARIQAGKKSHAYVAKLEEQHEKKVAAGKPSY